MEVVKKLLKGILGIVISVLVLSVAVFYMSRLAPGDPLRAYYGDSIERMSVEEQENARERLGLDEPIYVQYQIWLKNAIKGEFGISYQYKQDVTTVIGRASGNTLILGLSAYLLTFGMALYLGCVCALHENSLFDKIACKLGTVLTTIPSFWIALLFILLFSVNLGVLPSGGAYTPGQDGFLDRVVHLILPLTVMVVSHAWYYAYLLRNRLLEETRKDYVVFALSKGLTPKQVLCRHCLRTVLPSYLSLMALSVPHILGGTYIVEKIFSYPGLGTLCFESVKYHDYNLLMVLTLLTAIIVILSNTLAQALSKKLDPRMSLRQGGKIDE